MCRVVESCTKIHVIVALFATLDVHVFSKKQYVFPGNTKTTTHKSDEHTLRRFPDMCRTDTQFGVSMDHMDTQLLQYRLGCPPAQDASHNQEYDIFRLGDPNLNLHFPLASWEGGQPKSYRLKIYRI